MKVHHFTSGFIWDREIPSLTIGCKRLRPLAPKLPNSAATSFDLKSFIRPESGPRRVGSSDYQKKELAQVDAQPGGTRWNPTQEQIDVLEMMYKSGMRTPNAQQIEQITDQLGKYGKIEGKNVFYWFQNHKARERQKQKRNHASHLLSPTNKGSGVEEESESNNSYKRKWTFEYQWLEEDYNRYYYTEDKEGQDRTLKLFPLHPEGRY